MATAKLYNLARVTTTTTGTGTINLGSAVPGALTFADAGVQDGDVVSYSVKDGTASEVGRGTYSSTGPTLARTTVLKSTNGGSAIALTGNNAEVFITALAEDFDVTGNLAGGVWTSSDVASAATCDIGAATTPCVRITGTTTITSLGTQPSRIRFVRFTGSLTLTYNSTSLILPGAANIITAAGDSGIFASDASGNWKCMAWTPIRYVSREKLSGDRTYYVRTDGSDSNDGLSNSAVGAFQTIQHAYDVISRYIDLGGFTVTIQAGESAPTLTNSLYISTAPTGGSNVVLDLNGGTLNPTNPFNAAIYVTAPINLTLQNGTYRTTTAGHVVFVNNISASVNIGANFSFGQAGNGSNASHMRVVGGAVNMSAPYSINGSAQYHYHALIHGKCIQNGVAITLSGTLTFSTFAISEMEGVISSFPGSYSGGTVSGQRYAASLNGVINTFGGGANFFPGSTAGSTGSGGQYA